MAKVTDDERREVAEMLRGLDIVTDITGWKWIRGNLFGLNIMAKTEDALRSGLNRLADLIDPDCEEGRYSVARTTRPVDRDALLEQVEELEKCAWYFGLDFDEDEPLRDRLKEASEAFAECVSRIREALGVQDA